TCGQIRRQVATNGPRPELLQVGVAGLAARIGVIANHDLSIVDGRRDKVRNLEVVRTGSTVAAVQISSAEYTVEAIQPESDRRICRSAGKTDQAINGSGAG